MSREVILDVRDLKQYFQVRRDLTVKAVDGVSFQIERGKIFGLMGESGCGKSTVARSVTGLYRITGGSVLFKGYEISRREEYRRHREDVQRNMQLIFQDSAAALNPRMTVRRILEEPLAAGGLFRERREREERIRDLLRQTGLGESVLEKRPGELSGGQRQRTAIARALGNRPELIVADEPIASLDLSIQAQILNLFSRLQREYGFSFLFIAHDLSVIRYLCDEVGIMLQGKLVERAGTEELFNHPIHPYTRALLSAVPIPDPAAERRKKLVEYDSGQSLGQGELRQVRPGHWVWVRHG